MPRQIRSIKKDQFLSQNSDVQNSFIFVRKLSSTKKTMPTLKDTCFTWLGRRTGDLYEDNSKDDDDAFADFLTEMFFTSQISRMVMMTATLPSATKLLWLLSTNARRRRLKLARAAFPDEVDSVTTAVWLQQLEGLEGDV